MGETLEEALHRELGRDRHRSRDSGTERLPGTIFPDAEGKISYHYVLLDFLCCYIGGEPRAGSDILELCFTPLPCLKNFELTRHASAVILKALNPSFLTEIFSHRFPPCQNH